MTEPIVRNYDKKTHKRCIKCKKWQPRETTYDDETGEILEKACFGKHESSDDGLQSICQRCKNKMNTKSREQNTTARLRHHISTRCAFQLGKLMPDHFARDLEDYLGYRIKTLVKHLRVKLKEREGNDRKLRDALNEGYHVDHIKPLSSYMVICTECGDQTPYENDDIGHDFMDVAEQYVDWEVFKLCWAVENLEAIPADENLKKGAKYTSDDDNKGPTEGTPITTGDE